MEKEKGKDFPITVQIINMKSLWLSPDIFGLTFFYVTET